MNETKVTPGPWYCSRTSDRFGQSAVRDEETGNNIAVVYDGDANARLIASAPALLQALEAMTPETEPLDAFDGSPALCRYCGPLGEETRQMGKAVTRHKLDCVWLVARAALESARGPQ